MAVDRTQAAEGVSTTSTFLPVLTQFLSSYNVTETAGTTAVVKIRDTLEALAAPSAVDAGAGNSTTGLHMFAVTQVTRHGESTLGTLVEFTTAGSKIITVALPLSPKNTDGRHVVTKTKVVGRRLYATKAGAPATGVNPTNAQWFLYAADLSATVAAGMNNMYMPLTNGSLTVNSTTNFAAAGNILVTTASGKQVVAYTSIDATHFLGCTGGEGLLATGNAVTQPHIGDNTTTTFSYNLADASLVNTRPATIDLSGNMVARVNLSANETGDMSFPNSLDCENGGGFFVEVTSGTVDWELRGK